MDQINVMSPFNVCTLFTYLSNYFNRRVSDHFISKWTLVIDPSQLDRFKISAATPLSVSVNLSVLILSSIIELFTYQVM